MTNGQCPRADDKLVRAKYWMFFSKSFLCRMTRLIPGATTPLPSQIFLRTSFCQICHRSSATWTKNTWKHQILAKSHTNYFGRLVAKFQQTAISSICLGAFRRFSAMISASFSYLISASEEGVDVGDWNPLPASAITGASLQCTVQMSQCIILTVSTLLLSGCTAAVDLLCKQAAHLKAAST